MDYWCDKLVSKIILITVTNNIFTSNVLYSSTLESNGAVMVTVEIIHKGVLKKFNGFGDNKRQGKRAAAKHALRYIRLN